MIQRPSPKEARNRSGQTALILDIWFGVEKRSGGNPSRLGLDAVKWYLGCWLDMSFEVSVEEHTALDCVTVDMALEYKERCEEA